MKKLIDFKIAFLFLIGISYSQQTDTVRVFVLAGQSNMQGKGWIAASDGDHVGTGGSLEYYVQNDPQNIYQHLVESNGDWVIRDDVQVWFLQERDDTVKAGLTPGYGSCCRDMFGPELQFGHVLGNFYDDPVLLIKTAWGGKAIADDFNPPSASGPGGYANPPQSDGDLGYYYTEMIRIVENVMNNMGTYFPSFSGMEPKLTGFGWFQGWNDGGSDASANAYEENLSYLIQDVRKDLKTPDLPFVVASSGFGGEDYTGTGGYLGRLSSIIHPAQMAVGDSTVHPEFSGTVASVNTKPFWRDKSLSSNDELHHWNRNAESYFLIGQGMGDTMISLLGNNTPVVIHMKELLNDIKIKLKDFRTVTIDYPISKYARLSVFNVQGKRVKSITKTDSSDFTFKLNDLPRGIYSMRLRTDEKTYSTSVVVIE